MVKLVPHLTGEIWLEIKMYKCLARRTGPQPSHMDPSRLDVGKGAGSDWVRNGGTMRGKSGVPGCRILNRVRGSSGTQDKQDENVILFCSLKARDWLILGAPFLWCQQELSQPEVTSVLVDWVTQWPTDGADPCRRSQTPCSSFPAPVLWLVESR